MENAYVGQQVVWVDKDLGGTVAAVSDGFAVVRFATESLTLSLGALVAA